MERLIILDGRLYKSVAPTKYLFKVQLVGRFMALVGVISRPVESPLYSNVESITHYSEITGFNQDILSLKFTHILVKTLTF